MKSMSDDTGFSPLVACSDPIPYKAMVEKPGAVIYRSGALPCDKYQL